jgi:hypothetical protein
MPLTYNLEMPIFNDLPNVVELGGIHPARGCQRDGFEPKLGRSFRSLHVNMRRLDSLQAIEEKAVRTFSEHFGHELNAAPVPRNK